MDRACPKIPDFKKNGRSKLIVTFLRCRGRASGGLRGDRVLLGQQAGDQPEVVLVEGGDLILVGLDRL